MSIDNYRSPFHLLSLLIQWNAQLLQSWAGMDVVLTWGTTSSYFDSLLSWATNKLNKDIVKLTVNVVSGRLTSFICSVCTNHNNSWVKLRTTDWVNCIFLGGFRLYKFISNHVYNGRSHAWSYFNGRRVCYKLIVSCNRNQEENWTEITWFPRTLYNNEFHAVHVHEHIPPQEPQQTNIVFLIPRATTTQYPHNKEVLDIFTVGKKYEQLNFILLMEILMLSTVLFHKKCKDSCYVQLVFGYIVYSN